MDITDHSLHRQKFITKEGIIAQLMTIFGSLSEYN